MKSLKFILAIIFYQLILLSCLFASENDKCAKIDNAILSLKMRITEHLAKLADFGENEYFVNVINLYKEEIEEYQKKIEFCQVQETCHPQQTLTYRWVDLRGVNELPNNAVLGGQDVKKLPLHVVRGKGYNSDSYGKLLNYRNKYVFFTTDENTELVMEPYQVLVAKDYMWCEFNPSFRYKNTLFPVCRARHEHGLFVPGKKVGNSCRIGFRWVAHYYNDFEILIIGTSCQRMKI